MCQVIFFRLPWFVTGSIILLKKAMLGTYISFHFLQCIPVTFSMWVNYLENMLMELLTSPIGLVN